MPKSLYVIITTTIPTATKARYARNTTYTDTSMKMIIATMTKYMYGLSLRDSKENEIIRSSRGPQLEPSPSERTVEIHVE